MKKNDSLISVALYLRGEDLDPVFLSNKLSIKSSSSQYKGEKKITSTGTEYVIKTGVWQLAVESQSNILSDHIKELISKIGESKIAFLDIEGVDEAFVAIFIGKEANEWGGGTSEFELSKENIAMLSQLGVDVHFEVTHVKK